MMRVPTRQIVRLQASSLKPRASNFELRTSKLPSFSPALQTQRLATLVQIGNAVAERVASVGRHDLARHAVEQTGTERERGASDLLCRHEPFVGQETPQKAVELIAERSVE